jgi:hypothetical protein
MDPALRDAVLGAGNIQSPTSTLGASNAPELAKLYQSSFQLPQSSGASSARVNIASDQVAAAKAAAALAQKKAADKADPTKYRKVPKDDGGFDFFDADGNQVDIATLTKATGTKPSEWLKDSENPIDVQYLEDYNNLQDYIKAKLGGDAKKAAGFEEAKPELANYQGQGGADNLINEFKKYYQRFYVTRAEDPNAWGNRPSSSPLVPRSAADSLGGGI